MTVSSFFLELLDNRIVPACSGFGHSRDVTLRPETILEEGSAVVSLQSLWQGWWWTNHEARACCNFEGTSWRWGQDVIDVRDVGGKPFTSDFLRSFRISKLKTVFFFFWFCLFPTEIQKLRVFFLEREVGPLFSLRKGDQGDGVGSWPRRRRGNLLRRVCGPAEHVDRVERRWKVKVELLAKGKRQWKFGPPYRGYHMILCWFCFVRPWFAIICRHSLQSNVGIWGENDGEGRGCDEIRAGRSWTEGWSSVGLLSCFSTALELNLQRSRQCIFRYLLFFPPKFLSFLSLFSLPVFFCVCLFIAMNFWISGFAVVPPHPARCGESGEVEKLSVAHTAEPLSWAKSPIRRNAYAAFEPKKNKYRYISV